MKAAIFDLDGTILDSMYVWRRVDEIFFQRRDLPLSVEYGRALAGLSFAESAAYTIDYYHLNESPEDILREWMELAQNEYAHHVALKNGAREYLNYLRHNGVRTAVATALPEYLYRPCLENLGIIELFDALCSTDETGGRGKGRGEVYQLAASRLGIDPADCVVFEDVAEGLRGAKIAGMRCVCVHDPAGAHAFDEMDAIADRSIDDYYDLLGDRRCLIFTARCDGDARVACGPVRDDDLVLCADAGWKIAESIGVQADAVIGDFDSSDAPHSGRVITFPVRKDDTDTMLCVKYALAEGIRDFRIVGGLGGRIDHTLANIQTMMYIAGHGARCELCDGLTRAHAVRNDSIRIPRTPGKLSVFAVGGRAEGVSIRGTKYEVEDVFLQSDFPLGMGNDFTDDFAEISVRSGTLLVIADLFAEHTAN